MLSPQIVWVHSASSMRRAEPSAGFLKWVLGSNDSEMRQTWNEQWNISDPFQLPRYVSPRTYEWIRHRFPLNPDAFNHDASGRFAYWTMYQTLCRHGIRYRLEGASHERGIAQGIRDPREILEHPHEGPSLTSLYRSVVYVSVLDWSRGL